jgi:predicted HicB family RNase H-like nuclease
MSIPKKPSINETEFIKAAKTEVIKNNNTQLKQKEKTFLLKLDYNLWKRAKEQALKEDKTLHQHIIDILNSYHLS